MIYSWSHAALRFNSVAPKRTKTDFFCLFVLFVCLFLVVVVVVVCFCFVILISADVSSVLPRKQWYNYMTIAFAHFSSLYLKIGRLKIGSSHLENPLPSQP